MQTVQDIFGKYDTNKDGVISSEEFSDLLHALDPQTWSKDTVGTLFQAADTDGNGALDLQELIKWIFTAGNKIQEQVAPTESDSESDDGASSSSSSSDSGEEAQAKRLADKALLERSLHRKQKAKNRRLRHEEPLTNIDQMYEIMTMHQGTITHLLELRDLIGLFAQCKRNNMSPFLSHLIPQEIELSGVSEDLSALEVGHLHKLTKQNKSATVDDAMNLILTVKEDCRNADLNMKGSLRDYGLDDEAVVGFGSMKRVLTLTSGLMEIDQTHLVSFLTWAYTDRFLMTEAMAITVMEKLFLKVGTTKQHVLEEPVASTNVVALFGSSNMLDVNNVTGIGRPLLELTFRQCLQHMPKRLAARHKKVTAHDGSKTKPRKRHHNHKAIVGRTQLSVLFEDIYRAMETTKCRVCTGPLHLVLTLLERMP